MALISCPDCGKMVSSRAAACPNCGCPKEYFNFEDQISTPEDSAPEDVSITSDEKKEELKDSVDARYSIGEYEIYSPSEEYKAFAKTFGTYVLIAEKAKNQLIEEYINAGSIQKAITIIPEKASQVLDKVLDGIMEMLFQCGINMSIDEFINKYYSTYNMDYSVYYESAISKITDILNEKRAFEEYKEIRNASRSRWTGGGFGIKGAIKGAFTASVLNAGTDFVRSVGDAWRDPSNADFKKRINALYFDEDMFTQLTDPIYDCVINAFYAFKNEMRLAGLIDGDLFVFNEKEADTLFYNSKKYSKNREELVRNTLKSILLYPIKREYYLEIMPEIQDEINKGNNGILEYLDFWGLSFFYPVDKATNNLSRAAMAKDAYNKAAEQIPSLGEYIHIFKNEHIKDMNIEKLSKLYSKFSELYLGEELLFEYEGHGLDILGTDRILFINGNAFYYDEIKYLECIYEFDGKKTVTVVKLFVKPNDERKRKIFEANYLKILNDIRALCSLVNIMLNYQGAQNSWRELLNDIEFSVIYTSLPSITSYNDCSNRIEILKQIEVNGQLPSNVSPLVGVIEEEVAKYYLNNLGGINVFCRDTITDNYESLFSIMIADMPFYKGKNKILSNIWFSIMGREHDNYPQKKGLPSKIGIDTPVIISYSSNFRMVRDIENYGFLMSETHMLTLKNYALFSLDNIRSITKEDENNIKISDDKKEDVIRVVGVNSDPKDISEKNICFLINLLSFFCVNYAGNSFLWTESMGVPRPVTVVKEDKGRGINVFGLRFLENANKMELRHTYNVRLRDVTDETLKSKLQYSIEASPESYLLYYDGEETLVTDDYFNWHSIFKVSSLLGIEFDPEDNTHPILIKRNDGADFRTMMTCDEPEVILAINEAIGYKHAKTVAFKFGNKKFDVAGKLTDTAALAFGKVYVSQKIGRAVGNMILSKDYVRFVATDKGEAMSIELANIKKCEVQGDHFIILEKGRFLQNVIYSKNDASWVKVINAAMQGQNPPEYVYITENGLERGRIASIKQADKLYDFSTVLAEMAKEKNAKELNSQSAEKNTTESPNNMSSVSQGTIFCVYCGNKILRQSNFCTYCGKENKYGRNS